jgi:hypothetical protein
MKSMSTAGVLLAGPDQIAPDPVCGRGRAQLRIARENLARICENELAGRCTVSIVDVLEDFSAAAE